MRKISVLIVLTLLSSLAPAAQAVQETPVPVPEACPAPLLAAVALPGLSPQPLFLSNSPYTCGCPASDPCFGLQPDHECLGGAGRCVGFKIGPDPIRCSTDPLLIRCECMVFEN